MSVAAVAKLGPLRVHAEVVLVALGIGLWTTPEAGLAFFWAVLLHEVAHSALSALFTRPNAESGLRLQLGSGVPYLSDNEPLSSRDLAVLLAGPVLGAALGLGLAQALLAQPQAFFQRLGPSLIAFALIWNVFQLSPLPVADGGVILRRQLGSRLGRLRMWRLGWGLGLAMGLALMAFSPALIEPVVWLLGLSIFLARSEVGHVRLLEAYEAYDAGDPRRALEVIAQAPSHLPRPDRARLAELGLHAAFDLEDPGRVEGFIDALPGAHPLRLEAVTWLLRRDSAVGARAAERVHDAVDAEQLSLLDSEGYADLTFYHAVHEALHLRPESSLGLLERAVARGFKDRDRIEAEPSFDRLRTYPRFRSTLEQLKSPFDLSDERG